MTGFMKGMQAKSVSDLFEPQREPPTRKAMSGTLHELMDEIRKIDSASPAASSTPDVDEFISHVSREILVDNMYLVLGKLDEIAGPKNPIKIFTEMKEGAH